MLDQPYSATLGMLHNVKTAAMLISAIDPTPRTRGVRGGARYREDVPLGWHPAWWMGFPQQPQAAA